MSRFLKKLLPYAICILAGLLIGFAYLAGHDFLSQGKLDKVRLLCDAFFLPGILMLLSGCLVWMSNEGALDGVGFVLSKAFLWLLPGGHLHIGERYGDYIARRREKNVKGFGFLFWVGVGFMLVAVILNLMFNHLHG